MVLHAGVVLHLVVREVEAVVVFAFGLLVFSEEGAFFWVVVEVAVVAAFLQVVGVGVVLVSCLEEVSLVSASEEAEDEMEACCDHHPCRQS